MDLIIVLSVLGLLVVTVIVLLAVGLVRERRAKRADDRRAGQQLGPDDPAQAFDRAAGKSAWARLGGPF